MKKKRRNLVNDMKYHYTYRITNIKEGKYYYGVHSCDCLPKEDIGIKYFSSFKKKEFIKDQKENPQNYKYKVIKIFSTRVEAVKHEIFLHKKFDVKLHEKFYNEANQTSTGFDTTGKSFNIGFAAARNKITNEIVYITTDELKTNNLYESTSKNRKLSQEAKDKISIANTGNISPIKGLTFEEYYGIDKAVELKHNMSIVSSKRIGDLNAFYGKKHTDETKEKIASASVGMAVYISENGENIRLSVEEANTRELIAQSKGRAYSEEVNKKKGRTGEENGMYGKKHTDETKEKIKQGWYECRPKTLCQHCNKMILKCHNRFHFDNCKFKVVEYEN